MSPTQRIPRRARRAERRGEIHDREPPAPLPGPRARADHPRGARPERLPLQRAPALASSRTDAATLSLLSARRPGDDAGRCGAGAPRRDLRVEAPPVVADAEGECLSVEPELDRDGGSRAGVLRRVLHQLEAAEVDGKLDLGLAQADVLR